MYAFKTKESEPEIEKQQPSRPYEETIKALTDQ
jgi:hypothetical protein